MPITRYMKMVGQQRAPSDTSSDDSCSETEDGKDTEPSPPHSGDDSEPAMKDQDTIIPVRKNASFPPETLSILTTHYNPEREWHKEELTQLQELTGLKRQQIYDWGRNRRRSVRKYAYIDQEQHERLCLAYHRDKRNNIPPEERKILSRELGLKVTKVTNWVNGHHRLCRCQKSEVN
ncbi:hypothetical protein PROFUN_04671 [Planoprotostelium fungivorum]|uniref:Homeobox domain-containing protein n=1 Tax=Planoprotostelium fungivorum TaxID=1890364 RepID=A0A2P6NUK2_9EUKA|nr:hypothetical protein PROFUN_04671 [Planoprotostelium fungivorum]